MAAQTGSLAATGTARLGDAGQQGRASRWVVQLSGTWVGTVLFQGIIKETAGTANALTLASNAASLTFTDTALTTSTAGATGTTGNGIFSVIADGLDVQLNWTRTSGTLVWNAIPLAG